MPPPKYLFLQTGEEEQAVPDQLLYLTNPARLGSWNKDGKCAQILFLLIFSILSGCTAQHQCERKRD